MRACVFKGARAASTSSLQRSLEYHAAYPFAGLLPGLGVFSEAFVMRCPGATPLPRVASMGRMSLGSVSVLRVADVSPRRLVHLVRLRFGRALLRRALLGLDGVTADGHGDVEAAVMADLDSVGRTMVPYEAGVNFACWRHLNYSLFAPSPGA